MVGKIFIKGQIGTDNDGVGVELIDIISQVRKQPEATAFEVHINSIGGRVDTGFDIYNYLKSLGLPLITIGSGMVASMATVIFMAGDKRVVSPGTKFMIHLPMGGIENATSEDLDVYAKDLKVVENKIVDFYSKEIGIQKEAITPLLRNETWLTEKQIYELGFATIETDLKIAAKVKNSNQNQNKMTNKKSKFAQVMQILTGKDPVAKVVFTADNKEINFPDLGEEDEIVIGATATVDGQTADGEITAADGRIMVFEAGVLTEIKEKVVEEEEVTEEEMIDAFLEMAGLVASNVQDIQAIKAQFSEVKKEKDDYKTRLESAEAIIAKLKGNTSKTVATDPKDKGQKVQGVSGVVAQWKSNKFKKN